MYVSIYVARSSSNLQIILLYPLAGLFEYLFMFWLHRNLPAKQALNSKQSSKGYERIIWDIWLLYMSSSLTVRPQRKYRTWHYWPADSTKIVKSAIFSLLSRRQWKNLLCKAAIWIYGLFLENSNKIFNNRI